MPLQFPQGPFINPFPGLMGLEGMGMNRYKSPLEALFGKPQFQQEEIPPNMADIIGTLTKMGMQVYLKPFKFGPRRQKTCLPGVRTTKAQTSLRIWAV